MSQLPLLSHKHGIRESLLRPCFRLKNTLLRFLSKALSSQNADKYECFAFDKHDSVSIRVMRN